MDDSSRRTERAGGPTAEVVYRETLRTPLWWYLVGTGVAVLISAEFHLGGIPVTDWLPYAVLIPGFALFVWWLGRGTVEVTGGVGGVGAEVRVRGAHLPLHYCSGVVALDAATLRRVVGREGDPLAFVAIRPWIGPGVQLWVDDAEDPTPYWVLSTRHPDRVVQAVRSGLR